MTVVVSAFALTALFELAVWLRPLWIVRRPVAFATLLATAVSTLWLQYQLPVMVGVAVAFFSAYRIVNSGRLAEGRVQADYLYAVSRRASWYLIGFQAVLFIAFLIDRHHDIMLATASSVLLGIQLLAAVILLRAVTRSVRTTRPPNLSNTLREADLPTLTVAIPARNETEDLETCIQTLLASTYPKLEILVLDDCSQNKRTPEIIKQFAHDGVRFMAGQEVPAHWLAKNYAYHQLALAANGELLLFCGVDARFEPQSLRSLVTILLEKKKTMLSIIPKNNAPARWDIEAMLVQPNRYAWELALPRRLFSRPPVLSTCWLITAGALKASGGLPAASKSVNTERHFARWCAANEDGYTFMQSDSSCGISTAKSFVEQRATAIRVRYPQLHRRIELTALVTLAEITLLVGPFISLLIGLVTRSWPQAALSGLTCCLLIYMYATVVKLTYRHFLIRGLWLLPFAALYDIALLNYSMWKYEFNEVVWKGRNVCIPVMRAITKLPTL